MEFAIYFVTSIASLLLVVVPGATFVASLLLRVTWTLATEVKGPSAVADKRSSTNEGVEVARKVSFLLLMPLAS